MAFYTLGLFSISFMYAALNGRNLRLKTKVFRGQEIWLFTCMILFVLLWGLRDVSIGLDTASYSNLYDWATRAKFSQYDIYWIEPGYALLTMFCAQLLHLSYHQFLIVVSLFCSASIYVFVKRYSLNWYVSILVFIAFPFMAFYMSGIRNAIVISIVLLSIRLLEERKISRIILYEVIVIVASFLFHKSGLICVAIPLFAYYKRRRRHVFLFYVILPGILIFGKGIIYRYISANYKYVGEAGGISLGVSFFVYASFYALIVLMTKGSKQKETHDQGEFDMDLLSSRMLYCSLIGSIASNGASDILSRMIIFYQMFYMISIPNSIEKSEQSARARNVTYLIVIMVLLAYFYVFVLLFDPYGIVPYATY